MGDTISIRANGPVVYLAQANGLGNGRYNFDFGPTVQPFVLRNELNLDAAVARSSLDSSCLLH